MNATEYKAHGPKGFEKAYWAWANDVTFEGDDE